VIDHEAAALRAEAHAFAAALAGLPAVDWEQPTRCTPWLVRDVVGHVVVVVSRIPQALTTPPPPAADTSAAGYYRGDERYSPDANADRVHTAARRAAETTPDTLVNDLVMAARAADEAYRATPDRLVRTRHGDAMLLADFMTTRVVELATHGLDVADALDVPPWLTPAAAGLLPRVMVGPDWHTLGWDPATLLRKLTGRAPVSPEDTFRLSHLGARGLAFG
jgi:uncharacterized protein (TIGR03083 family)